MKILQLVNRIPYPLNDGGSIGIHYYTEGYIQAGVSLSMLAMNTFRHWVVLEDLPDIYGKLKHFVAVPVDNRVKVRDAFFNLFKGTSYNIDRFINPEFEQALIALLQKENFDIIQLEGLFVVPYLPVIRTYSKAKVVIRQHNIEFRIWERLAEQARNPFKKMYLRLLAKRLKRFELEHMQDYDLILPISREDEQFYKKLGHSSPVYLHPFGVDTDKIPFLPVSNALISLYHIGAMDWQPNLESVNWLLEKIMPLLRTSLPEVKLYLAGRNMPDYYKQQHWDNVEVVGEVPDARAFEQDKSILLVPLLSGGGVRIKIFQAMAMGKAIVTTPIGVEGIEAEDGVHLMIADTPELFAAKIIELVSRPDQIRQLGTAARLLMSQRYDQKKLIIRLLERYRQLL